MSDLFSDLYRFRQRENKNNLEDWLTECLAAVLRELNRDEWQKFLIEVTGADQFAIAKLLSEEIPEVRTQVQAGGGIGIPDLVIFHRDQPFVLFENKVAHSVSVHENDAGEVVNQLHRYARWLVKQSRPGAEVLHLVFLTHLTRPPADFGVMKASNLCPYEGIARTTESWGRIARTLSRITRTEKPASLAAGLAKAFQTMLENENMANEFPDTNSFAALQIFLKQGAALENLVSRMWDEAAGVANSGKMSARRVEAELDYGRYSASRYANAIASPATNSAFLMTGIWYPEVKDVWQADELGGYEPTDPHVFLLFADDKDDVFTSIHGVPGEGWHRPNSDFLALQPLYSFKGSPDSRAASILEWVAREAKLLRPFLLENNLST
ncbi:type I restriction enzyme HsdR N-terminal domain-containing protein [Aurantiacibacter zhengii]|uniref:type I restriction enzyme HsdR N-terminal domain-containing protein n=1 Tax=Aurantiacibacter zhengii TaxID=2307003 RepID=UPI0011C21F4B|nr:type I restriction enzyme HsdR N-terminal domain-containing protein [Aurantiacibacter zhengii]